MIMVDRSQLIDPNLIPSVHMSNLSESGVIRLELCA